MMFQVHNDTVFFSATRQEKTVSIVSLFEVAKFRIFDFFCRSEDAFQNRRYFLLTSFFSNICLGLLYL